jgi:hypothetical protein
MFKSCENKGFQITFENGCTISVQWGPYNYCGNKYKDSSVIDFIKGLCRLYDIDYKKIEQHLRHIPNVQLFGESEDAEIAIWDSQGTWYKFGCDTVNAYCSPNEVAEWVTRVSQFPEGHCFPTTSEQSEEEENQ